MQFDQNCATPNNGETGRISQTALICVVDDDASLLRSLRNLLNAAGLQVETFASAIAFLQSEHRHRADCALVDLQMPGLSGVGLLLKLRESKSTLPVIILTAHGDEHTRECCLRAGAMAFLAKPFTSDELLEEIQIAVSASPGFRGKGLVQP